MKKNNEIPKSPIVEYPLGTHYLGEIDYVPAAINIPGKSMYIVDINNAGTSLDLSAIVEMVGVIDGAKIGFRKTGPAVLVFTDSQGKTYQVYNNNGILTLIRNAEEVRFEVDSISDSYVPIDPNTAYVNKSGDDITGTKGDASKPFLTIQAAATAVGSFGLVVVGGGVYTEDVTMSFLSNLKITNTEIIGNITISFGGLQGDRTYNDPAFAGTRRSVITGNITGIGPITITDISLFTGEISGAQKMTMINVNHEGVNLLRAPLSAGTLGISGGTGYYENVKSTCGGAIFSFDKQGSTVSGQRKVTIKNCEMVGAIIFENWDGVSNFTPLGRNKLTSTGVGFNGDVGSTWTPQPHEMINLDYCEVDCVGHIIDFEGNKSQNLSMMHSVIKSGAAENINWTVGTGVINIKEAYTVTRKEHNTLGKANYIMMANHTVDGNL